MLSEKICTKNTEPVCLFVCFKKFNCPQANFKGEVRGS